MADETYYSLLETSETATAAEIKAAYLRLIREVHPDRLANAPAYWQRQAEEKAKEINEAYAALSNHEKRHLYDVQLAAFRGSRSTTSSQSTSQPSPPSASSAHQQAHNSSRPQYTSSANSSSSQTPRSGSQQRQTGSTSNPRTNLSSQSSRQPFVSAISAGERFFFALVLSIFAFGATGGFWSSDSIGSDLFSLLLSGTLLFGVVCLYLRPISQFLGAVGVRRPRHQLWATIGTIVVVLLVGKIANVKTQSSALPIHPDTQGLQSGSLGQAAPASKASEPIGSSSSPNQPNGSMPVSLSANDVEFAPALSLPNGTELRKRGHLNGVGELTVENGTSYDAVVHLVDLKTEHPIRTFYVRQGSTFTERQIATGLYGIYFATGLDWNRSVKKFTTAASYSQFGRNLEFSEKRDSGSREVEYATYKITLQTVVGGDVSPLPSDKDSFDKMMNDGATD